MYARRVAGLGGQAAATLVDRETEGTRRDAGLDRFGHDPDLDTGRPGHPEAAHER
jgi:hypothetical protein